MSQQSLHREVRSHQPRLRWLGSAALTIACGVMLLTGARWWFNPYRRVEARIIDRVTLVPVPTLCEDRSGMWLGCPWVKISRAGLVDWRALVAEAGR